jgi:hypothetical protein
MRNQRKEMLSNMLRQMMARVPALMTVYEKYALLEVYAYVEQTQFTKYAACFVSYFVKSTPYVEHFSPLYAQYS